MSRLFRFGHRLYILIVIQVDGLRVWVLSLRMVLEVRALLSLKVITHNLLHGNRRKALLPQLSSHFGSCGCTLLPSQPFSLHAMQSLSLLASCPFHLFMELGIAFIVPIKLGNSAVTCMRTYILVERVQQLLHVRELFALFVSEVGSQIWGTHSLHNLPSLFHHGVYHVGVPFTFSIENQQIPWMQVQYVLVLRENEASSASD